MESAFINQKHFFNLTELLANILFNPALVAPSVLLPRYLLSSRNSELALCLISAIPLLS